MNSLLKTATILLFLCSPGFCQGDPGSTIKHMLIDRIDAMAKKDVHSLEALCTKDYRIISPSGNSLNLKELESAVSSNKSQIKSYTILSFQPFIVEDEAMAFALYEVEEDIVDENLKIAKSNLIITEIYRKEKSKWKTQLTHTSQKTCSYPN
jgi:hypothetical protein